MKTNLYTKIVLTVIAACLCINLIKDVPIVSKAWAQTRGPVEVQIVGIDIQDVTMHYRKAFLPVKVIEPVKVKNE